MVRGGGRMNNLWDHTGAAGAGYAQPAPLVAESELNLATSLLSLIHI